MVDHAPGHVRVHLRLKTATAVVVIAEGGPLDPIAQHQGAARHVVQPEACVAGVRVTCRNGVCAGLWRREIVPLLHRRGGEGGQGDRIGAADGCQRERNGRLAAEARSAIEVGLFETGEAPTLPDQVVVQVDPVFSSTVATAQTITERIIDAEHQAGVVRHADGGPITVRGVVAAGDGGAVGAVPQEPRGLGGVAVIDDLHPYPLLASWAAVVAATVVDVHGGAVIIRRWFVTTQHRGQAAHEHIIQSDIAQGTRSRDRTETNAEVRLSDIRR